MSTRSRSQREEKDGVPLSQQVMSPNPSLEAQIDAALRRQRATMSSTIQTSVAAAVAALVRSLAKRNSVALLTFKTEEFNGAQDRWPSWKAGTMARLAAHGLKHLITEKGEDEAKDFVYLGKHFDIKDKTDGDYLC